MAEGEIYQKHEEADGVEAIKSSISLDRPKKEDSDSSTAREDVEAARPQDPFDWDSPEDPGNPHNWKIPKKIFHTAVPAIYGFLITVSTSVYVPAVPLVMKKYNVSREVAILPLSLYTLGLTLGPILSAPMSEIYGRRPVYWATMTLLVIFTAASGASNSVPLLIVMRLLAGLGGSGALATGAGTVADLWGPKARGSAALFFILTPFLGPSLGPLIGAYITSEYHDDWRYTMWVVLMIAAPVALVSLFMQETFKARILYHREKKLGIKIPHQKGDTLLLLQKLRIAFYKPLIMVSIEPLVALLSIYTGFAFAMMFSFFNSYNYVYVLVYDFNEKQVGLAFLGILIGLIFAMLSFGVFEKTLYAKAVVKSNGKPAPEHRLYCGMLGSVLLPIGLFWFAWAPQKDVHWIVPTLAGIPFGWGCLAIFFSAITYLVDTYLAENSASALAGNGILRYGCGAVFPLFTFQMYDRLGIHWAGSTFAFISLALMPVPWVFFWKGKALRAKSHYKTSQF